jgi:hypothetical protein
MDERRDGGGFWAMFVPNSRCGYVVSTSSDSSIYMRRIYISVIAQRDCLQQDLIAVFMDGSVFVYCVLYRWPIFCCIDDHINEFFGKTGAKLPLQYMSDFKDL